MYEREYVRERTCVVYFSNIMHVCIVVCVLESQIVGGVCGFGRGFDFWSVLHSEFNMYVSTL